MWGREEEMGVEEYMGGVALTISSAFIEEDIILTHENKLRGGFLPKPLNPPLHAYAHDVNAV